MFERKAKILRGLDIANLRGAEIGALDNALVAKSEGHISYVDHCDTETMREKYAKNATVDKVKLQVDAVWGENSLLDAMRASAKWDEARRLDYVLASHVIEHVPDVVGWLKEVHATLAPGGTLRLAIPDKRYTFDHLRRTSTLAEALEAYVLHRRVPAASRVLDFTLHVAPVDCNQAWAGEIVESDLVKDYTLQRAITMATEAARDGVYHDVHCWVFTPESFARLCAQLAEIELLDFECEYFLPTPHQQLEFYIGMKPSPDRQQISASWRALVDQLRDSDGVSSTDRSAPLVSDGPADRISQLLAGLDLAALRGAEISALDRPLVSKTQGDISYIDHCDTAALRAKYAKDESVDASKLQVDAVWGERSLSEALRISTDWSESNRLHYVLASHVIEHVPDLVGWLREVHATLNDSGTLRLAVPDRRYTFDYLRRTSTFPEVLEAHLLRRRVPSASRVLDFTLNMAMVDIVQAWGDGVVESELIKRYSAKQAMERGLEAERHGAYFDVHCWVFTPKSFAQLCIDLCDAELLEFECDRFCDTQHHQFEFIVAMKPSADRAAIRASWLRMLDALMTSPAAMPAAAVADVPVAQDIVALVPKRNIWARMISRVRRA